MDRDISGTRIYASDSLDWKTAAMGVPCAVISGVTQSDRNEAISCAAEATEGRYLYLIGNHTTSITYDIGNAPLRILQFCELKAFGFASKSKCAAGQFGAPNSDKCTDCAAGKYALENSVVCSSCPPGQYTAKKGLGTCVSCAGGSVSSPAQYSTSCEQCVAGKFFTKNICQQCARNSYQSETGEAECQSCPTGSITNFKASTSKSDCIHTGVGWEAKGNVFCIMGGSWVPLPRAAARRRQMERLRHGHASADARLRPWHPCW